MEATAWLHATDYISDREIFNTIVVILARHLYNGDTSLGQLQISGYLFQFERFVRNGAVISAAGHVGHLYPFRRKVSSLVMVRRAENPSVRRFRRQRKFPISANLR
jgi:hypothetical protein